jgi:hypothetical protein
LHHAIRVPSLTAGEQGIGLFWTEDAQQSGAGVRVAEGVSHGGAKYIGRKRQAVMAKIVASRIIWHTSELIIWRTSCERM